MRAIQLTKFGGSDALPTAAATWPDRYPSGAPQ
jgi:hypothetical protein